jgi:hypothetical protein
MYAEWTYQSPLSPAEYKSQLKLYYDAQEELRLVARLSDGGAVVRSLHPPDDAARDFFGHETEQGFHLVHNRGKINLTPYQPILHGRITTSAAGGSRIQISLKPHRDAKPLSGLFLGFGIMLMGLGSLNILIQPYIGITSFLFGICFAYFPKYRATFGFKRSLEESQVAWEGLPIEQERIEPTNEHLLKAESADTETLTEPPQPESSR